MMRGFLHHPWAFWFGILGNIISFLVFLSPLPTFRRVYKKKTTEGFQSVPYVVALFSAKLWIFYALIKTNSYLLITINSIGCFIESIYIIMYFIYAPKKAKVFTAKLFVLLDVLIFGAIVALSMLLSKGSKRVIIVGWICMCLSISVFVAPLSIIRLVVCTKSVEFMPFFLSLFLTLSAVVWFFYGLLTEDIYVAVPNVLGIIFGIIQMALYLIYKRKKVKEEIKQSDHVIDIPKLGTPSRLEVQQIDAKSIDIQDVKEIIAGEEKTDKVPCKNESKEGQGKIDMPQNHKEKVKVPTKKKKGMEAYNMRL